MYFDILFIIIDLTFIHDDTCSMSRTLHAHSIFASGSFARDLISFMQLCSCLGSLAFSLRSNRHLPSPLLYSAGVIPMICLKYL